MDTVNQIDLCRDLDQAQLNTTLLDAAKTGNLAALEVLIEKGAKIDARDGNGSTSLMYAASNGHIDMAAFLIQKGANLEAKDMRGATALALASLNGHMNTPVFLLQKGAKLETTDNSGRTPLILAYNKCHFDTVYRLLSQMTPKQHDKLKTAGDHTDSAMCKNFKKNFKENAIKLYNLTNTYWNLIRIGSIFSMLPIELISYIQGFEIQLRGFSPWYHHRIVDDMNKAIECFMKHKKQPLPILFSNKRKAQNAPEENRPNKKIDLSQSEINMVIEEDNNQLRSSI